jgi:hypothetical protein
VPTDRDNQTTLDDETPDPGTIPDSPGLAQRTIDESDRIRTSEEALIREEARNRTATARAKEDARTKERDAHHAREREFEDEQARSWANHRSRTTTPHNPPGSPSFGARTGPVPPGGAPTPFTPSPFDVDAHEHTTPHTKDNNQGHRRGRSTSNNSIADIFFTKKRANNISSLDRRDTNNIAKVTTFLMDIDKLHNGYDYNLSVQALVAMCPDFHLRILM